MSRRLVLVTAAVAGTAAGAYFMPRVNPYFASRAQITRGQARSAVVEKVFRDQSFDARAFFSDAIFVYDYTGLDYLMGAFGVKAVIDMARQERLPLSYWQFDFYRNAPRDPQQETFRVRVSASGKLVGFMHTLPDSAAGDTLSTGAALQLARAYLQDWPDVQFADFKLEQSSSTKKVQRTDYKLVFVRTHASLGEGSEVLEAHVAGSQVVGAVRWFRDPQNFVTASGVVGATSILINTVSVAVFVVLFVVALVAFLRKYHGGEIGVRSGLWLGGLVFFALIPSIVLGLWQGVVFWRYGLLASMTSEAVVSALNQIGPLLGSESPLFLGSGIAGVALLFGVLLVGFVAASRGSEFEYTPDVEPAHIRRIKERVRLQKELEIARRVQLGLLPKTQPQVAEFDIAGACIPALEVGGDYYDFVELRDGNLGIAVGDVSGKGVPAAIYMTLTKGILQSHAEEDLSPKQALSKVNHLMYRAIERSWFVSMFYAVLDCRRRLLRYARAGHNPAIVFRSGEKAPQFLQTAGIGLGLEVGEVFCRTLVEGELQLSGGDTLVFYTDGFTEAMNERFEEFGDKRFLDLLQRYNDGTAEQLVQRAFAEVRGFAGDHPQHDDMTIVVLKAR